MALFRPAEDDPRHLCMFCLYDRPSVFDVPSPLGGVDTYTRCESCGATEVVDPLTGILVITCGHQDRDYDLMGQDIKFDVCLLCKETAQKALK